MYPIEKLDYSLPFDSPQFNDRDFEHLCAELFEHELGVRFHQYGRSGDEQHGIDLISESNHYSPFIAIQCKRVKKFQPADLEREIKKLASLPHPVSTLYFALTCNISNKVRELCHKLIVTAKTSYGPIDNVKLWDREYISRKIKKYPNLVGSYFGLTWRSHLFPDFKVSGEGLDEILKSIERLRKSILNTNKQSSESLPVLDQSSAIKRDELTNGIEGYFRLADNIATIHGNFPSNRGFSFKYQLIFDRSTPSSIPGQDNPARVMFSVVLTSEEAVDLEAVLLMDKMEKASVSTYYSHDILLTHIFGQCPLISLPNRDISFVFAQEDHYSKLLQLVGQYLDQYTDIALAARRERNLMLSVGEIPKIRSVLFGIKYDS